VVDLAKALLELLKAISAKHLRVEVRGEAHENLGVTPMQPIRKSTASRPRQIDRWRVGNLRELKLVKIALHILSRKIIRLHSALHF